jgi:hypothetical protein
MCKFQARPFSHTGKIARGILRPCYEHHAKVIETAVSKFEFLAGHS